ncbi:hypothetical protein GS982_20525 [Rhodococcus hoagii]|nr:hypothetical protein [Prescottella equi]NKZ84581.1 hypothetical protein [Prescottella equi]
MRVQGFSAQDWEFFENAEHGPDRECGCINCLSQGLHDNPPGVKCLHDRRTQCYCTGCRTGTTPNPPGEFCLLG